MNITKLAITRPIFIFMLMVAAILLGAICYSSMRLELNPDVSFNTITVSTTYPGASPDDINQLVSKPIEDAVSGVSGIREVTSTSQEGFSTVALTLELGTDITAAVNDVRSKVDSIADSLPKDALKPEVLQFDTTSSPVYDLSVSASGMSSKQLRDLIDNKIKDRFAQIQGVVSVGVSGGDVREIQVRLRRDKLLQYGLGIADIQNALANASLNLPAGHLVNGAQDYTVRVKAQFETADQVGNMIVPISDPNNPQAKSSNVHLKDIADVVDSAVERTSYARLDGEDTIAIVLEKAHDGNSVDIANQAQTVVKGLETEYSNVGLKFTETYQEGKQITDSLTDLRFALAFGILLVATIVYVFLHNFRGTLIVALAIPTCIFASFIGMKMLGFTINSMSMLSLSLAIGVLVDDAIVVLENIYRHLRLGEDPRDAALNGRYEIGIAALAITMADVVVFLPIGFMQGIVGQFFKPMALGFVCAVLFSLFVSFTLTPLLASRWYKAGEDMEHPKGRFAVWFEKRFASLEDHYRNALEWALHHRWFVFITGNVTLFAIIQFIMGASADKPAGAIQAGGPLFAMALVLGALTMAGNFVRKLPKPTRKIMLLASFGVGIVAGLIAAFAHPPSGLTGILLAVFTMLLVASLVAAALLTIFSLVMVGVMFLASLFASQTVSSWKAPQTRYLAYGALFGLVFPLMSFGGYAFRQWKGEDVFKVQFIPDTDNGQISANIQLPPGSSLAATQSVVAIVEKNFGSDKDMKYVLSTVGQQGAGGFNTAGTGTNFAQVTGTLFDKASFMDKMPWASHAEQLRTRPFTDVSAQLTQKIGRIPGAQVGISTNGSGFGSPVQLSFTSDDHDLLLKTVQAIHDKLQDGAVPGVINPILSTTEGKPELQILPKREQLADAGVSPQTLATAAQILYQGNNDTKLRVNGREYGIRVMMDLKDRDNPDVLKTVPITFVQGNEVTLGSVADVIEAPGINQITRRQRAEEISISADTLPGFAAGTVNTSILAWLTKSQIIPVGVHFRPLGQADAQARESGFILGAFALGLVLVYMLLASLYDNLLYPLIIQLAQPQAIVGAILGLIIMNKSLNLVGIIGIIALIGLVGKNAILLVDYTNTLRDRGRTRHDALVESGPTRLRPIMMTTLALILGMLPVALAIGRGSEFRETIGITIIGGISLSTLLTLLVIPCSYTIFDDITITLARLLGKKPQHMKAGQTNADDDAGSDANALASATDSVAPVS